jgi:hypothetical protein
MENIMIRVHKALRKEFSPKEILLQSAGGGMVGGWIISKSFARLTEIERQQKVWNLFDKYLTEKDRRRIVGFLTFTPLEKKMAFDDDFDRHDRPLRRKASSSKKKTITAGRKKAGAGKRAVLPA